MITVQILDKNHSLCQYVGHRSEEQYLHWMAYILKGNICVKCRINNLTLPMTRKQTMRTVTSMQPEKGKIVKTIDKW